MAKKILIGLSLAVVVMLAVPLGLMAASVIRGESPKQMAEKEQLGEVEAEPGSEDGVQTDVLKPVVQPDPGPMPPPPVLADATEDAAEPEAEPAPDTGSSGKKTTKKAAKKPQTSKSTLPKAVLGPDEAPCMVDGLDGYAYDY